MGLGLRLGLRLGLGLGLGFGLGLGLGLASLSIPGACEAYGNGATNTPGICG